MKTFPEMLEEMKKKALELRDKANETVAPINCFWKGHVWVALADTKWIECERCHEVRNQ